MTMHTPGDWTRNGNQIYSVHTDEDGDHETLICEVFDEHGWWRANVAFDQGGTETPRRAIQTRSRRRS